MQTTPLSPRTLNKTCRQSLQGYAKQDVQMVTPLREGVSLMARPGELQIIRGESKAMLHRYSLDREGRLLSLHLATSNTQDIEALKRFLREHQADQAVPLHKLQFKFYREHELDSFWPVVQHFQLMGRLADHQALCKVAGYGPQDVSLQEVITKCSPVQEEPSYRISLEEWWQVQQLIQDQKQEIAHLKRKHDSMEGVYIKDTDGLYIEQAEQKESKAEQLKALNKMVLGDLTECREHIGRLQKEVQHILSCGYGAEQEERIRIHQTALLEHQEASRLLQIEIDNMRRNATQDQHELLKQKKKQKEDLEAEVQRLEDRADPGQEGLATLQRQNKALEERLAGVDSMVRQLQVRRKVMLHQA